MTVLEVVTLGMAPSLIKLLTLAWLDDAAIAEVAKSGLSTAFSALVRPTEQRPLARKLEEVSEQVASSLVPLFQTYSSQLDDGDVAAVVLASQLCLEQIVSHPRLLIENNLDAEKCARALLGTAPETNTVGLGGTALGLYERVVLESLRRVFGIIEEMPSFRQNWRREMLERQSVLMDTVDRVLAEQQRIRAASETASMDVLAAEYEVRFASTVVRALDRIELFGMDLSAASRRHRLSLAYVSLGCHEGDGAGTDIDFEALLIKRKHLLLTGDAGYGKTTLLKWVAVNAASASFQGPLSELNDLVPFYVRLRQTRGVLPSIDGLPGLISPILGSEIPDGWVADTLKSGRAILLLDGLDEIPMVQRGQFFQWLDDLIETYPDARVVLSTRPYAMDGRTTDHRWKVLSLQPMDTPQIRAFIDHWHEAVSEEVREPGAVERLEELRRNLHEVVAVQRSIRNLATTPLLCAMICALHRDRLKHLPTDRIELYESCIYMLIERRDIERQVPLSGYPEMSYRQKTVTLEHLAYWMMRAGLSEMPVTRADEVIAKNLPRLGLAAENATAVRRLLAERSGLVRYPGPGIIDFAHRTFQEFLAAKAAIDASEGEMLVQRALDDQWREVIVLAAGRGSANECEALVRALILMGDTSSERSMELHLLAVACLETVSSLSPALRAEIAARLESLVPPNNITQANALAAAGELTIPHLKYRRRGRSAVQTAACVRTLVRVGGADALSALADYAKDSRKTVKRELFKGWATFLDTEHAEWYANHVLSRLGIKTFTCAASSFGGLGERLPSLDTLGLHECGVDFDGASLSGLSQLRKLALVSKDWKRGEAELVDAGDLQDLEHLIVDGFGLVDVEALHHLGRLTHVTLERCRDIRGLESFAGARLQRLHLSMIESPIRLPDKLMSPSSVFLRHCCVDGPLPSVSETVSLRSVRGIDWVASMGAFDKCQHVEIVDCALGPGTVISLGAGTETVVVGLDVAKAIRRPHCPAPVERLFVTEGDIAGFDGFVQLLSSVGGAKHVTFAAKTEEVLVEVLSADIVDRIVVPTSAATSWLQNNLPVVLEADRLKDIKVLGGRRHGTEFGALADILRGHGKRVGTTWHLMPSSTGWFDWSTWRLRHSSLLEYV